MLGTKFATSIDRVIADEIYKLTLVTVRNLKNDAYPIQPARNSVLPAYMQYIAAQYCVTKSLLLVNKQFHAECLEVSRRMHLHISVRFRSQHWACCGMDLHLGSALGPLNSYTRLPDSLLAQVRKLTIYVECTPDTRRFFMACLFSHSVSLTFIMKVPLRTSIASQVVCLHSNISTFTFIIIDFVSTTEMK